MGAGLVGREVELARLRQVLAEAASGSGAVVLLAGEAGIGKSRLAAQVAGESARAGLRVLTGATTEDDGAPPHWLWLQVLDALEIRELLVTPAGADPEAERFARQVAVTAALLELPTVVVVEDLHRADAASLRLLVHLAHAVPSRSAVLLGTFRPDPADQTAEFGTALDELMRVPGVERIDLSGLDLAAVTRLLGAGASPEAAARVSAVSDGNPLLVGELARHLAAGGTLETVPGSVRDSVHRRLAARSEACVEAICWAAPAGRDFPSSLVAQASSRDPAAVLTALDEAVDAGLLEPGPAPGRYRFVHALIRDAVAGTMRSSDRAARHRTLAQAIEAIDGGSDDSVADLARHWDAASVLGDSDVAATWCERAADVADRRLAWDEAARLFDRALELGGRTDPVAVARRALGSARARLHCDDLASAADRCVIAARAAIDAGRVDLLAEAVLVPEARGVTSREVYDLAETAVTLVGISDHTVRARLFGQLVNLGFHVDPRSMQGHTEAAESEAALADDPRAELSAVRARHMISAGPDHAEERLVLAERLGAAARALRSRSAAVWEPLWRFDALMELGRVPEAGASLAEVRAAVTAAETPIARWHLERVEVMMAQATGRFSDAIRHAEQARVLYARLENAFAAAWVHRTQVLWIDMHAGETPGVADQLMEAPLHLAPENLGDMPLLATVEACLRRGETSRAESFYRRAGAARNWSIGPHMGLYPWALRLKVAAALDVRDDLRTLLTALERHRGRHVWSGGMNYLGPLALWTGIAHAALGHWDNADRELSTASEAASTAGTPPFVVHADVERAATLTARAGPGDADTAVRLLEAARPVAARLGMAPFLGRIDASLQALPSVGAGPLSPREAEVVVLIADGLTNREIARRMFISERTAQNHVQHILTKLCLSNRREVAAWYRTRSIR